MSIISFLFDLLIAIINGLFYIPLVLILPQFKLLVLSAAFVKDITPVLAAALAFFTDTELFPVYIQLSFAFYTIVNIVSLIFNFFLRFKEVVLHWL